jgi:hypothetical protein
MENHLVTERSLTFESDLRLWDQHMLNAFYSYCFSRSVLPQMNLTATPKLLLVGSVLDIGKASVRYELMCQISREKYPIKIGASRTSNTTVSGKNMQTRAASDGHNIYFSHCRYDESLCDQVSNFLINEGYILRRKSAQKPFSLSDIEKSDLVLIAFSEYYLDDSDCMAELLHAK